MDCVVLSYIKSVHVEIKLIRWVGSGGRAKGFFLNQTHHTELNRPLPTVLQVFTYDSKEDGFYKSPTQE